MIKQIFVNFPVKDLDKTIAFFTSLGFKFEPKFTDENATCMIIGENMFAMFLVEKFFSSFTPGKKIADSSKKAEVINAISAESKEEVDEMLKRVIAAGGTDYRKDEMDWMYSRAFLDLDNHIWEIFHMDESNMPEEDDELVILEEVEEDEIEDDAIEEEEDET